MYNFRDLLFIICFLFFIMTIFYYFYCFSWCKAQTDIKAVTVLFKTRSMAEEDISFILNPSFLSDEEEQTGHHVDDQV